MAYIKRDLPGQSSAGGMLGSGQSTRIGNMSSPSTAARPGEFYNIQEFLRGNQGNPKIQQQLQNKVGGQIEQGKQMLQQTQQGLSTPQVQSYNPQDLTSAPIEQVRTGLTQTYSPKAVSDELPDIKSTALEAMKPQDFGSIMDFMGQVNQPSAQYSPGMQKMDELLLRGQPDFVNQFLPQAQERFQQEVTNPLEQARQQREAQNQQIQQQMEEQRGIYGQNLKDFLNQQQGFLQQNINNVPAGQISTLTNQVNRFNELAPLSNQYLGTNYSPISMPIPQQLTPEQQVQVLQSQGVMSPSKSYGGYVTIT